MYGFFVFIPTYYFQYPYIYADWNFYCIMFGNMEFSLWRVLFVRPLQTYIHIGKSPSKRFKMRMMQYFKHIEYADKILSLLLLFDVVYHISTNKRQRGGKRKAF